MKKVIIIIVLLGILLFGIYGLYNELLQYKVGEEEYLELVEYLEEATKEEGVKDISKKKTVINPDEIKIDFTSLKEINNDFLAWILIPGANINYPIVSGIDNKYYINHTFKKKSNKSGSIFMDMRNSSDFSDKNTILYGHNLKNGKMFSNLKKYENDSFFNANDKIYLYTENERLTYQVFSVFYTMEDSFVYNISFESEEKFKEYIDDIKEISIVNNEVDVLNVKKILTLSTCTNIKEGERIVVMATLIE